MLGDSQMRGGKWAWMCVVGAVLAGLWVQAAAVELRVADSAGQAGEQIIVEVEADDAADMLSADLTIGWDWAVLSPTSVEAGGLTSEFLVASVAGRSSLNVAMAADQPASGGSGAILRIGFEIAADAADQVCEISIAKATVYGSDGAAETATVAAGLVTIGDPNEADPNDPDPNAIDPNETDPNDVDPNDTDPNDADPNNSGPITPAGGCMMMGMIVALAVFPAVFLLGGKMRGRGTRRSLPAFLAFVAFVGLAGFVAAETVGAALGDVNGDGDITSIDAAMALRIAGGVITPSTDQTTAADVDEDGQVTRADAEMILYWAAQGFGTQVPEMFTEPMVLPELASVSGAVDAAGGQVALSSGTSLILADGQLSVPRTFTLSKCDVSELDSVGNRTCFQVSPDPSYYAGTKLVVLYSDLTNPVAGPEEIADVKLFYYDPATRMNEAVSVDCRAFEDRLEIALDAIRPAVGSATAKTAAAKDSDDTSILGILIADIFGDYIQSQETEVILSVPFYEQGGTGFCWAASTCMVANYLEGADPWKPWELVNSLNIPDAGKWASFYHSSQWYGGLIYRRTNCIPRRDCWGKTEKNNLKLYLGKRIMDDRVPVVLFLTSESHVVTVVGYEKGTGMLTIHDPARSMYTRRGFSSIEEKWQPGAIYYTMVLDCTARSAKAVACLPLSAIDKGKGLAFVSPMEDDPNSVDSLRRVSFNWRYETLAASAFRSHNGDGQTVTTIPNYYAMDLRMRLGNAARSTARVKALWSLCPQGSSQKLLSGEREMTLPFDGGVADVAFFSNELKGKNLNGDYVLLVEVYDTESFKTCDRWSLGLGFDEGIKLQAAKETDTTGKKIVKLTWNAVQGDFDRYRVYKRTSTARAWQWINRTKALSPTDTEFRDEDYDDQKDAYYVLAAFKESRYLLTSDVVSLLKPLPVTAHLLYSAFTGQALQGEVLDLTTGQWTAIPADPNTAIDPLGLSDSGVALFHVAGGTNEKHLFAAGSWGAASAVDLSAATGAELYRLSAFAVGITGAGRVYFTGKRTTTDPNGFVEVEYAIFSCDGNGGNPGVLKFDWDGNGVLDDFAPNDLAVSKDGSVLLFSRNENDKEWLMRTTPSGATPSYLTDKFCEDLYVCANGTVCSFQMRPEEGDFHMAVLDIFSGRLIDLDAATGLMVMSDHVGLSPDGSMACFPGMNETTRSAKLYIYHIGTGTLTPLETGTVFAGCADFTHDGQSIVFMGLDASVPQASRQMDIYTIAVDGNGFQNVTNTSDRQEAWDSVQFVN